MNCNYNVGPSFCEICSVGTYSSWQSNTGTTSNTACPGKSVNEAYCGSCCGCDGGTYSSNTGSSSCTICPQGTYSTIGQSSCTSCGVGYSTTGEGTSGSSAAACDVCAAGYSGTSSGGTSGCNICPQDTGTSIGNGNVCTGCTVGKYAVTQDNELISCEDCTKGKYSAIIGASECSDCPCGTFAITAGAAVCTPCSSKQYMPQGYQGQKDAGNCEFCPDGLFTTNSQPPCGAASCSVPTLSALDAAQLKIKSNIVYAATLLITLALGALGYVIHVARRKEPRLAVLTLLSISQHLAISTASLVSEISLFFVVFALGLNALGAIIVTVRA